jgi:hypothetical protein
MSSASILDEYKAIADYQNIVKKRIADSWNPDQEKILRIWAEKASGWAWLHDKSSRYYNVLTNKIVYPSILLSTISGGVGLSTYNMSEGLSTNYVSIILGVTNLVSACLGAVQKFIRSAEKSESHSHMNKLFSSFCRKIVMELALQPCDRKDCLEFCKACRDEYDNLLNDSLEIPTHIVDNFKSIFRSAKHVPEVASGLVHFHDFKQTPEGVEWERKRSMEAIRRRVALYKAIAEEGSYLEEVSMDGNKTPAFPHETL